MKKNFISSFVLITMLFNFNLKGYALEEKIALDKNYSFFLTEKTDNPIVNLFSPDNNNLEGLIAIILSIIPSFGVGHFWLGESDEGWFFLKLDFVMLILPILITAISTVFSSFNVVKSSSSNMSDGVNFFSILGLSVWASSLGIKIWETSSVIRNLNNKKMNLEKKELKVSFKNQGINFNISSF
ncbi:MAG: hypothetical protein AABZ74_05540 [Cyanobacteriota bacterium]